MPKITCAFTAPRAVTRYFRHAGGLFFTCLLTCALHHEGVPQRQPHRRSGLATLPSVGAIP